jgi:hypothetical protein
VFTEPAPYDALMMGAVLMLPLVGLTRFTRGIGLYFPKPKERRLVGAGRFELPTPGPPDMLLCIGICVLLPLVSLLYATFFGTFFGIWKLSSALATSSSRTWA